MSTWLRLRAPVDRSAAALLGVFLAPLIAALAYLVRWQSPGPGLVVLSRVGQDGRLFGMLKIRTMRAEQLGGSATGSAITVLNDSRVTLLGKYLRGLRIDELPQLWNVVRGDMATIGPRPESPSYVDSANADWGVVLRARPGIAGPTQVLVADIEAKIMATGTTSSYRDDILPLKLAIDRWYVESASPMVDLLILTSLAGRLIARRKPQRLLNRVCTAVPEAKALDDWY